MYTPYYTTPTRKPRVDSLVPTRAIDRQLGRIHVSTGDNAIIDMIETEIDRQTDPRWTLAIRKQTVRYALWRHAQNRAEYVQVMGSWA